MYEPRFPILFALGEAAGRRLICWSSEDGCSETKTSPSRRGMRRSADALKAPTYVEDKDSGELRRPHHVDLKSGMYKGRQVLKPKTPAAEA